MSEALLALGLLFTTATQLRFAAVPVGPGEVALVVWIVLSVGKSLMTPTWSSPPAASVLLTFWALLALALSVGMICALATGEDFEPDLVLHDALAYVLIGVVTCLCAATPVRLRRVCWMLLSGGALSLSLQLLQGFGLIHFPGVDPWYWDRLRGWSDNPNQLAIICLVLALLGWYLADTAGSFSARLAAILMLVPALVAGRMSQSDTWLVALSAALTVWLAIKVLSWMRSQRPLRVATARLLVFAVPVMVLALVPLIATEAAGVRAFVMGFAKNGGAEAADETNLRLSLWSQALRRGVKSGMLGLGPGPHLEIPATIVAGRASSAQPASLWHPSQNGTANYEAHDTLLDVFTQGGLLAVASLGWVLLRAMRCVYRVKAAGLVSLLAGVTVFMMTGDVVRQPVFWFVVVLCLTAAQSRSRMSDRSCGLYSATPQPTRKVV